MPSTPLGHRRSLGVLLGVLTLVLPLACSGSRGGSRDLPDGAECTQGGDCIGGFCVAGVAGSGASCTRTCASPDDCPEGWSCGAVTEENVLVCKRGGATPFGI